jgi:O-antigen/teichoic acid export membrane protein
MYTYLTNLLVIPVMVSILGAEQYGGLWAIVGALTAYIGLLDLGTGTAYVAFIAERAARQDAEGVNTVLASGTGAGLLFGAGIMVVAFLADDVLLRVAGVAPSQMDDARFVLHWAAGILALLNILAPLTSLLAGFQRMDLQALVTAGAQTLNVAGTLFVLNSGFGVRGLIVNNLVTALAGGIAAILLGRRLLTGLRLSTRDFRPATVRAMFKYGVNLFTSRLGDIVVFQTDRILSLRFFGAAAATSYDVSARLSSATRSVAGLMLGGLVAAFAGVDAREGRARSLALYKRATRYLAVIAAFFFGFVIARAGELLGAWMGAGYQDAALLVRLLAAGYLLNILTGAASAMAAGVGATDLYRTYGILVSVVNIPLTIGGALLFGPPGIAAGSAATLAIGGFAFAAAFHRRQNTPIGEIFPLLLKPIGTAALAAATVLLVLPSDPGAASRADFLPGLLLSALLYAAVFAGVGTALRLVAPAEVRQMAGLFIGRDGTT